MATDVRSLVIERRFDWQRILRPRTPWPGTVIYETHVRGLTIHPSARVAHPGTFVAVIEKIPHFLELGVTAVEVMPVQAFDVWCEHRHKVHADVPLRNYWGYDTIAFFAPHGPYATRRVVETKFPSSRPWCGNCTAPASKSSWTWCSITPPKARGWSYVLLPRARQRDLVYA